MISDGGGFKFLPLHTSILLLGRVSQKDHFYYNIQLMLVFAHMLTYVSLFMLSDDFDCSTNSNRFCSKNIYSINQYRIQRKFKSSAPTSMFKLEMKTHQ
jgi:hypothetical protein